MFIDVMLRRRASLDEAIPVLNSTILQQFVAVKDFWGSEKELSDAPLDFKGEGGVLDLRKALQPGLSGQAVYLPRFPGYLAEDTAQADDFLHIRVNTDKADYKRFCNVILPRVVAIFDPYRGAAETDEVVCLADYDASRQQWKETGRHINGRDSVYRIWPVNYFDDLLCQRSFGISADEVVRRVAPECERAELLNGGAFLIVTSELVTGQTPLDMLNERVRRRLLTEEGG